MICMNKTKNFILRLTFIFLSLIFIIKFNYRCNKINSTSKNYSSQFFDKNKDFISMNLTEMNEREVVLSKGRKYLDNCLKNESIIFHEMNEKPIITTIIPSYNCEKTIISAIHSVQYQNFSNFEIIIVDDFSQDKSKEIIKYIKSADKRMKLIENKKNMGTLYSRCIGALLSKGEYIFCLDNDDLFFDEDVFDYVYKQSIKNHLDIVSFRALHINDYFDEVSKMMDFHFFNFSNNLSLSQPELGLWTLTLNGKYKMHNHMIWSKSIKTSIYKQAVNALGIQRYSKYVCWAEDTSINFIIFNIASSFKYIYKFGYIHIVKKSTATFTQNKNNKLFGELFFLDIMFDFSKNNSEKNFIVNEALKIKKRYKIDKYSNNENYNYLKSILIKVINCPFIIMKNKRKIKLNFKNFLII